jgi:hypothetical protein
LFNFDAVPQVVGGPYQYGHAGARHAIIYAPEEVGGGEYVETDRPNILVIARDTVTSKPVLDAIRQLDHNGHWRFTLVSPAEDGQDVAGIERRQRLAKSILERSGGVVGTTVVTGEPVAAIAQAAKDLHAHEILFATLGVGQSDWLRSDLVDRVRKATGVAVSHVTVSADEAAESVHDAALAHVHVIAPNGVDGAIVDAIRDRVDASPARITLTVPAAVPAPDWGDEANARRAEAITAVHTAVESLRKQGLSIKGEVWDGSLLDAAKAIAKTDRPDEVLVAGQVTEEQLDAIDLVSRNATVRTLTGGAR